MPRPLHMPCVCVVSPPFQSAAGWITTLFDLDLIDALVRRVFKIRDSHTDGYDWQIHQHKPEYEACQ
jgi:hypothetical protein